MSQISHCENNSEILPTSKNFQKEVIYILKKGIFENSFAYLNSITNSKCKKV
jgi:hypothetical protein